jgi:hypothetical protein
VVAEVDEQVVFRGLDPLQVLVVEAALDEGLIVEGVADRALVDRHHLRGK